MPAFILWDYCEECGGRIEVGQVCFDIGGKCYCGNCCRGVDTKAEYDKRWGHTWEEC